jgi:putative methyltransferase (TIGR04325 family)
LLRRTANAILDSRASRAILSYAEKSAAGRRILNALSGQRGVFETFEQGWAAARRTGLPGHDDPNLVTLHMELAKSLRPSDYAALFWLRSAAGGGLSVFDFGGNAGNLFYSYSKYLQGVGPLSWSVFDIPPVLERGRRMAEERNAAGLRFVSTVKEFAAGQVLLVSGSLHYWERSIGDFVRQFPAIPRHIIINRTPISENSGPFVIVQRTATCAHPCIVRNAKDLISDFAALGYLLADRWAAPELRIHLPFFPSHSLPHYSGFYFRLEKP